MPNKKRTRRKRTKRPTGKILGISALTLAAALLVLGIVMSARASIVEVHYSQVYLRDLPAAFDGTTILFLSDLEMGSAGTPEQTARVFDHLEKLSPDLLLLGGDYASTGLGEMLLSFGKEEALLEIDARKRGDIETLMRRVRNFPTGLGKFAVAGEGDAQISDLDALLSLGGFALLRNDLRVLQRDGQSLVLVGLDDWTTGSQDLAGLAAQISSDACVLVLMHNPDALPPLNNQPTPDGGHIASLVLSGHTHGGQVVLPGGKALYEASIYGNRYRSGWYSESGVYMLVSHGLGTTLLPFRLQAAPQVHFLTLKRMEEANFF